MTVTDSEPKGVVVTIKEIYDKVTDMASKVDAVVSIRSDMNAINERLRKVENQAAAHWVIHGILIAAIVAMVNQAVTGG